MLGNKSVKTTEVYVRANRQNISDNMEMVERKMFDAQGGLRNPRIAVNADAPLSNHIPMPSLADPGARVIRMNKA